MSVEQLADEILIAVIGIDLAVISLWLLLVLCNAVIGFLTPVRPPYCDIDPRCHPALAWDREGNGWIGNVLAVRAIK